MTIQQYLVWFDEVFAPTERVFRLVPPDKLEWRLTESSFSLGQQLRHMPGAVVFFTKIINGEEWPMKSMREILVANRRHPSSTVDNAVAHLSTSVAAFKKVVEGLGDMRFQTGMLDTPQKGSIYYWRYCVFLLEHHIHHLMELHLCLRVLGVNVNSATLYGM
jgi:uncharacterized damage-inducible protein DinB